MLEPRVAKHENRLHLSYEVSRRLECSTIYPFTAPNGSTVILYSHDRGVRILWRGGKRRRLPPKSGQAPSDPTDQEMIIEISDDEDEAMKEQMGDDLGANGHYDLEEDEEDPDCPYPAIVHDVDIDLESEVLALAVPKSTSTQSQLPIHLRTHAVVAASFVDGAVVVFDIPLSPPTSEGLHEYIAQVKQTLIVLREHSQMSSKIAVKVITGGGASSSAAQGEPHLLLAALSNNLEIWTLEIQDDLLSLVESPTAKSIRLPFPGRQLSFHPSAKCNWLLIGDESESARIYNPFTNLTSAEEQQVHASIAKESPSGGPTQGTWLMSYPAPYQTSPATPITSRRKRILDTAWVLNGRAVLVLLHDGEWGIWNVTGQLSTPKSPQDFVLGGYLDGINSNTTTESSKPKKWTSKLAPMTPNTRKSKADNLFTSAPKTYRTAQPGGISVSPTRARSGQIDESIVIWYGIDVFAIPSMQAFWQRSLNSGSGVGSLYAPGLSHVSGLNLMNEDITSISQFAAKGQSNHLGQMNTARDLLISTEHRLTILHSTRTSGRGKKLFEPEPVSNQPDAQDQRMLDAGELTLDSMDRMLDNMAGNNRSRKVGFVSA